MAELIIRTGKHDGKKLVLPERENIIGRGDECHLKLTSPDVSKEHCLLRVTPEGIYARDLESRNGTWVNEQRIEQERLLSPGDMLRIGPMQFQVPVGRPIAPGSQRKDDPDHPPSDDDIATWLTDDTGPVGSGDTTIELQAAPPESGSIAPVEQTLPTHAERAFHTIAEEATDILRRWQQRKSARQSPERR